MKLSGWVIILVCNSDYISEYYVKTLNIVLRTKWSKWITYEYMNPSRKQINGKGFQQLSSP